MTDNRTTELREKLAERGVKHEDSELTNLHDGTTTYYTEWGGNDDGDGANVYVEYVDGTVLRMFDATPEQAIAATLGSEINGETSDGYHTFNELYHHRAVLFSVIVRDHRELAWKARKHHDGTMYDGMFIVGVETPKGQATYHYDLDPYWEMFDCKEREFAPDWDGHTPDEAIARIAELGSGTCEITATATTDTEFARAVHDGNLWRRVKGHIRCRNCGLNIESVIALDGCNKHAIKHCPNCGKEV